MPEKDVAVHFWHLGVARGADVALILSMEASRLDQRSWPDKGSGWVDNKDTPGLQVYRWAGARPKGHNHKGTGTRACMCIKRHLACHLRTVLGRTGPSEVMPRYCSAGACS